MQDRAAFEQHNIANRQDIMHFKHVNMAHGQGNMSFWHNNKPSRQHKTKKNNMRQLWRSIA